MKFAWNFSENSKFEFTTYSPNVFRNLRKIYGYDEKDYQVKYLKYSKNIREVSLKIQNAMTSDFLFRMKSPGKSKSFFYYSSGRYFQIFSWYFRFSVHLQNDHTRWKWTIGTSFDFLLLRKFFNSLFLQVEKFKLKFNLKYVQQYPVTFLSKFCGHYRIAENEQNPIDFIVMENVFGQTDVQTLYDLKVISPKFPRIFWEFSGIDAREIYKGQKRYKCDLERFGHPKRNFPRKFRGKISDFSTTERRRLGRNFVEISLNFQFLEMNNVMDYSLLVGVHKKLPNERNFAGISSIDGTEEYFIGVIDILTAYGWKKAMENAFKSIYNDENSISAVNPKLYRERFLHFLFQFCFA